MSEEKTEKEETVVNDETPESGVNSINDIVNEKSSKTASKDGWKPDENLSGFALWRAKRRHKKLERERREAEKSLLQNALETIAYVATVVCIALVIKTWVGQPIIVSGNSMNDTLDNLNLVWANKINYTPKRFDVVIVMSPKTNNDRYIKRVVALPGETIYVDKDNKIWITPADGGEKYALEDPYGYFGEAKRSSMIEWNVANNNDGSYTLGSDEYFVMGDNRYNSKDSRALGGFTRDEVQGHAIFRIWPLTKLGNFDKSNK